MGNYGKGDTSWFTHDRFGMFIHWGLYSMPARHEWVRHNEKIDNETYQVYFDLFNPDLFNPKEWAKAAREAGMKYFVITTKHHEGFCLWDTKYTDYKVTNTPAGRDLLRVGSDLLAGRVGELLRRRGQYRLPGFPRVGRARMACVGLHLALLRDVHVVIVGAGGPGFPCLVHVPETERHGLGRVVVLRELFGRGAGRAVQSGPMQGDGARHVLADRTVATARGDRVGHVAGRAGLGERSAGLRADGQIIDSNMFLASEIAIPSDPGLSGSSASSFLPYSVSFEGEA